MFSGIAEEAGTVADAEYDRLYSGLDDGDRSLYECELVEYATEYRFEYQWTTWGLQQGMLNLLAVGLHHLFEQQQRSILRLALDQGDDRSSQSFDFEKDLSNHGVSCKEFERHTKVNELRLAANAIKHGSGTSAHELAKIRSDLFDGLDRSQHRPGTEDRTISLRPYNIVLPLAGDHLYVTDRDLFEWCDAVIAYWKELASILD